LFVPNRKLYQSNTIYFVKSLLISSIYFPPQMGGISHTMRSIADELGPDHCCCLTGVPAPNGDSSDSLSVRVYRRPWAFSKLKYLQPLGWGASVAEIMLKERPNVVQLATADEGYLGLWLRHWFNVPFVVYAHGNEILAAMRDQWPKPRQALLEADRILANSEYTARLVEQAGVDAEKIVFIGLGCDSDQFRPLAINVELRRKLLGRSRDGDRVILTVGRLVPRKGYDMVIRALVRVRRSIPNVTYLIIGDGPYQTELEKLALEMGVRDRVHFAGRVAGRELAEVYALCDVYAMPSRDRSEDCDVEGFGLVFLEANACGKPVVGGRSGGIPEAVADGVTGLLVNPEDPTELADAIARILSDRELAERLGQQGRARIVRDFSWRRITRRVGAVLEEITRKSSRSAQSGSCVES